MYKIKLFLSWILAKSLFNNYIVVKRKKQIFSSDLDIKKYDFKTSFFKNMYVKYSMLNLSHKIGFKTFVLYLSFFSSILFVLSTIIYKNVVIGLIYFFIPFILFQVILIQNNILENNKIIFSLNLMVKNLIQLINSNLPFKICIENIQNLIVSNRFKKYYEQFIVNYKSFGYNLSISSKILEENFKCKELNYFVDTLKNYENDDNFLDSLNCLNDLLNEKENEIFFKKLNKKKFKMTFTILLLLLNCFVIILYPLINDIRVGICNILK